MDNQQMNAGMPQMPAKKGGAMKWIIIIIVLALIIWGAMTVFGGSDASDTSTDTPVVTDQPVVPGTPSETTEEPTLGGEVVSDVDVVTK